MYVAAGRRQPAIFVRVLECVQVRAPIFRVLAPSGVVQGFDPQCARPSGGDLDKKTPRPSVAIIEWVDREIRLAEARGPVGEGFDGLGGVVDWLRKGQGSKPWLDVLQQSAFVAMSTVPDRYAGVSRQPKSTCNRWKCFFKYRFVKL